MQLNDLPGCRRKLVVSKPLSLFGVLILASMTGACSSEEMVLFDGKSMDGWAHTGEGYFGLDERENCLISRNGMGMLFYYDRQFEDFDLTLDFSLNSDDANSGVFIRFPNLPLIDREPDAEGRNLTGPWGAVNEGYEIQIHDDSTGSLYSFEDSSNVSLREPGAWNEMKIRAVGQHYQVWVNGKQVGDYQGERALKGYIGVQNHDPHSIVRFRNIRIKELEEGE